MLTLNVSHNIFLTKQQRYDLCKIDTVVETIGVSVPVWFYKGRTSEPAKEVFCKYILSINDNKNAIKKFAEGYIVNLPKNLDKVSNPMYEILKDEKDLGKEMVQYKEYSISKIKKIKYQVMHVVEIYDESILLNSIY